MDIMSKFTVKPLLIALAVMTVLAGAASFIAWNRGTTIDAQQVTIDTQEGRITSLTADNQTLKDANDHQTGVIDTLAEKFKALVGKNQELETARADAVKGKEAAVAKLNRYQSSIQQQRQVIYANDANCKDWAARPVCPAVSDSLRDEWQKANDNSGENPAAGNPNPPIGGNRPEPAADTWPSATTSASNSGDEGMSDPLLFERTTGSYATASLGWLWAGDHSAESDQSLIRQVETNQRQVNLVSLEW